MKINVSDEVTSGGYIRRYLKKYYILKRTHDPIFHSDRCAHTLSVTDQTINVQVKNIIDCTFNTYNFHL